MQDVAIQGHAFEKSGESWGDVLISEQEQWVALLSFTGAVPPPPARTDIFRFLGGCDEPQKGTIFLDIYNVATQEKTIHADIPYKDICPSLPLSGAFFVDEKYFIIPVDLLFQTAYLGILPDL